MKKVLAALAVFITVTAHAQEAEGGFRWACQSTGKNGMQCVIKNTNREPMELCVDVVKVCKNEDHHATMCSGTMQPGEVASKVVRDFRPKVRLFESCMGVEYRDKVVR